MRKRRKRSIAREALCLLAAVLAGLLTGALTAREEPRSEKASGGLLPLVPETAEQNAAASENAPEGVLQSATEAAEEEAAEVRLPSDIIRVSTAEGVVEMELEEYVFGVVAGEMSAAAEEEALKAQAVAARTFAAKRMTGAHCPKGADICTDAGCCQAYLSEEELKARWGESYGSNAARVRAAAEATRGLTVTYNGELINALYHASSGPATESSEAVFACALPYLVSVESPETEAESVSEKLFSAEEAAALLSSAFPEAGLGDALCPGDIEILARTESGRAERVRVGAGLYSGMEVRMALGLKSAAFTPCFEADGKVSFTCVGYGHGVGMSQTGANGMAAAGADFREILAHYYVGTEIARITYD
ncbi:MAG: stage II sporulation protein D [Clostridia bacterium]|nr:stage II sporulation protein D [Clostridia bacterium]